MICLSKLNSAMRYSSGCITRTTRLAVVRKQPDTLQREQALQIQAYPWGVCEIPLEIRGEVSDDSQEEAEEHSEDEPEDNKEEEEEKNEEDEEAEEKDEEQARAAKSDADDGMKGQQAEPKFSGPLPLAKRFFL